MAAILDKNPFMSNISGTNPLRRTKVVSKTRFWGSRNSFLSAEMTYSTLFHFWSDDSQNGCQIAILALSQLASHLQKMILVYLHMFSWSRNTIVQPELLYIAWKWHLLQSMDVWGLDFDKQVTKEDDKKCLYMVIEFNSTSRIALYTMHVKHTWNTTITYVIYDMNGLYLQGWFRSLVDPYILIQWCIFLVIDWSDSIDFFPLF